MATDKPTPPKQAGKAPRRFTRLELDPRGGPSRIIVDGVDLAKEAADSREHLDLIYALTETMSDDVEALKEQVKGAHTLTELGRMGRDARAAKLAVEPWRVCAQSTAIAATKLNPTLINADLKRMILEVLAATQTKFDRDPRTLERLLKDMRDAGTLPPSAQEK
jgi:hypothetical protein